MNTIKIESEKPVVVLPLEEYESMKETIEILSAYPDIIIELNEERKKINRGQFTLYNEFKKKHAL